MKKCLYLLKIGGSLIGSQRGPNKIKYAEIKRILKEIYDAKKSKNFDIIIGHGCGVLGHALSKRYNVGGGLQNENTRKGSFITERFCNRLNDVVTTIAFGLSMPVFSFSPHSFSIVRSGKVSSIYTRPPRNGA